MASLFSVFNRLLPFATPGTPLVQDLVHLGAICALLYFAPQIQEWLKERGSSGQSTNDGPSHADGTRGATNEEHVPLQHPQRDPILVEDANGNLHANDDAPEMVDQAGAHADQVFAPHEIGGLRFGPADGGDLTNQRNVGAKKAKSLARKDQRRAYNEFMRSQGEAQRARDAEGEAERDAVLAVERKRRADAEAELEAKKAKEREMKREVERREREDEYRRRELTISLVRESLDTQRMCDLFKVARQIDGDVDEEWVERVLKASGLLGMKDKVLTMITSTGWAVRVSEEDAMSLYEQAVATPDISDADGYVDSDKLGDILASTLARKGENGGF